MFKHNILIAIRKFRRNPGQFLINLIGLSTGLASAILIYLWVSDEMSIDSFHANDDELYHVMQNFPRPEEIRTNMRTPAPLAEVFEADLPEVEMALSVKNLPRQGTATVDENNIKVSAMYAGTDFFNVFSFPLQQGNKDRVFQDRSSIAISADLAEKLFGDVGNVVGKTIKWNHNFYKGTLEISAVFDPVPAKSTLQFDMVMSMDLFTEVHEWANVWNGDEVETYVVLTKGTDVEAFNEKVKGFLGEKSEDKVGKEIFLQKYSDRYLFGEYADGKPQAGRIGYVRLFSFTAIFIVLIACINFVNLSTAQASQKMNEIGVKKALGSNRGTLITQFLAESIVMSVISISVALFIVLLLIPQFNELTSKNLGLQFTPMDILLILGLATVVGVGAGSYPAFYVSRFDPATVLKGSAFGVSGKISFSENVVRKVLVIFQFSMSLIFIIAFMVINRQLTFVQTTDIGYEKDDVIHFQMKRGFDYTTSSFMSALRNVPGVQYATNTGGGSIVDNRGAGSGFTWEGQTPDQEIRFGRPQVGIGFIETLGIEILEGRSFSADFGDESAKLIVNKAAADFMGFDDVVGRIVTDSDKPKQIIGVVANFNVKSLREEIQPCFIRYMPNGRDVMVKLSDGLERETIGRLKAFYENYHPGNTFEFAFIDQQYNDLYQAESRVAKLSTYFTGIAIIISCLGIFGLASFTVRKRRKEIAIRKLHGSSISGIIKLLSIDFMKVIGASIIIGVPVSYFLMQNWLEGFAFRINLSAWYFIGASLLILIISYLTVGIQSIKAARSNPVNSLRYE